MLAVLEGVSEDLVLWINVPKTHILRALVRAKIQVANSHCVLRYIRHYSKFCAEVSPHNG